MLIITQPILKKESFIDTPRAICFCSVFKEEFSNCPLRGRTASGGQRGNDGGRLEAEARDAAPHPLPPHTRPHLRWWFP